LLDPKTLSPETIAVTFAKTSRSPQSFREIASELTEEKSAQFHEKWVVGYGHASVAEHAVLHIAIENVSRLAVESIQSNRLASYTEKSTRYQKWSVDSFFTPPEVEGSTYFEQYQALCRHLFVTYLEGLEVVQKQVASELPRLESDSAWERAVRTSALDVCRYLLPAAALANLGMTANARVLEHAISKMLSSPLTEVQQIGQEVRAVAQVETPTLVKYANPVPYLKKAQLDFVQAACDLPTCKVDASNWMSLLEYDPLAENKVLAAVLFRFGMADYTCCYQSVRELSDDQRQELVQKLLGSMGVFDNPLRELEHAVYRFEIVMDQGAYAEFKRHRMMSLTTQGLGTLHGYAVPSLIQRSGFGKLFCTALERADALYRSLAQWNPSVAAYITPNAFNRRVLVTLNLRQAFHLCALRSAPKAHFAVRRVAQRIAQEIRRVHPTLAAFLRVDGSETWQGIERDYFDKVY
jgi:thymidylate synthase ThyX